MKCPRQSGKRLSVLGIACPLLKRAFAGEHSLRTRSNMRVVPRVVWHGHVLKQMQYATEGKQGVFFISFRVEFKGFAPRELVPRQRSKRPVLCGATVVDAD